ncbi:hypothetical protein D3C75_846140 [compost metagenome]
MAGRQQGIQWFVAERLVVERLVTGRQAATQFQFATLDCLFDATAAAFEQLDRNVRVTPPILGEQPGEQRVAAQHRQAQAQFTAAHLAEVVQFAEQCLTLAQQGFATLQHDAPGSGQVQLRGLALQQRLAHILLKLGHLLAHGRLADVQGLCGLGKTAAVDHFDKAAQLFEFHDRNSILEWCSV